MKRTSEAYSGSTAMLNPRRPQGSYAVATSFMKNPQGMAARAMSNTNIFMGGAPGSIPPGVLAARANETEDASNAFDDSMAQNPIILTRHCVPTSTVHVHPVANELLFIYRGAHQESGGATEKLLREREVTKRGAALGLPSVVSTRLSHSPNALAFNKASIATKTGVNIAIMNYLLALCDQNLFENDPAKYMATRPRDVLRATWLDGVILNAADIIGTTIARYSGHPLNNSAKSVGKSYAVMKWGEGETKNIWGDDAHHNSSLYIAVRRTTPPKKYTLSPGSSFEETSVVHMKTAGTKKWTPPGETTEVDISFRPFQLVPVAVPNQGTIPMASLMYKDPEGRTKYDGEHFYVGRVIHPSQHFVESSVRGRHILPGNPIRQNAMADRRDDEAFDRTAPFTDASTRIANEVIHVAIDVNTGDHLFRM